MAGGKAFIAAGSGGLQVLSIHSGALVGSVPRPDPAALGLDPSVVVTNAVSLKEAEFDRTTSEGEVTVKFIGELTSVVRNADGDIVEGNPNEIKRQKDVWTFARVMGADDPNWQLVATGE